MADVPFNIFNYRRELCERCPTPCEFQLNETFRAEGENACPQNKWMAYQLFQRRKLKGAGDVVASVAEPIAGVMDKVFKTRLKGCSACAKRKEMLNHLIPFGQKTYEDTH